MNARYHTNHTIFAQKDAHTQTNEPMTSQKPAVVIVEVANNKTITTTTTTRWRSFLFCIAIAVLFGLVAASNVYYLLAHAVCTTPPSLVTTVADLPLTAVPVLILACIHWVAWQLYIHN